MGLTVFARVFLMAILAKIWTLHFKGEEHFFKTGLIRAGVKNGPTEWEPIRYFLKYLGFEPWKFIKGFLQA